MKTLPEGLQRHLESGATTLCWCWRVTRRDGVQLGFTDHDRTLGFAGTTFEAVAGFEAGDIAESVGLGVDNLEVGGAITSERLTDADLGSGRYDDAKVEIFRVNWQAPDQRVLMRAGSLGEVRRAGQAFTAEIRGISHYLQQPKGRLFQYACDTDLGSAACGIDLTSATYRATAVIDAVDAARTFRVTLSGTYQAGWFARGLATVTHGAAEGFATQVRAHAVDTTGVRLTLWEEPVSDLAVGNVLVVTAGCDKQFVTCRDRFRNALNFRGFPHMPGNDFVTRIVQRNRA